MATVRGYSADEVDLLVEEFERLVVTSLDRVTRRVAADLSGPIVGATSAGLGPADVANVTVLWQDEVDGVLTPYIASVYQGSATSVAVHLVDAFPDDVLPGVPLVADDFALDYMKIASNRLVGVGDELWEDCRNELIDGIKQGQSIEQVAARIQNVSNFNHVRANRIARTEVHSAAEAGNIGQLKAVGYSTEEVTKTWEATLDLRTRDTHTAEHGKSVQLDEKFVLISGHQLDYPGDPFGAPGEVINCRCTTLFDIADPPKQRCVGSIIAAATSSVCIVPTPTADVSHVPTSAKTAIFNRFMASKISPAWGGAKIYKVLQEVRKDLPLDTVGLDDWQLLSIVDNYYVAKKDTFTFKFNEWFQSPAGKKVVGSAPGPSTHAKMPVATGQVNLPSTTPTPPLISPANPASTPLKLPPLPAAPKPGNLEFTGKKMSGATGAQVWHDKVTGERWLVKTTDPMGGIYSNKYLFVTENFAAKVQSKALQTRPAIYVMNVNGKKSIIQSMFDGKDAFPTASSFDPLKLSAADIHALQQEQVFDWMISNFDTHTGQWLRLADGQLIGIDKGQAFKFFGKDKLAWDYAPVTPLHPNGPTYQKMWQAYVQGKNVDLQDPTQGPLGEYIDRLTAIPDADYKSLLSDYAKLRFESDTAAATKFLQAATDRKNSLKADFADFWQRAQKQRALALGQVAPKPATLPTPSITPPSALAAPSVTPSVGATGDISNLAYAHKLGVGIQWSKINGGKSVTPAWGGAKIFKGLVELKKWEDARALTAGDTPLNELQLLRVLDEHLGFKGKPKTFESVVIDWLQDPKSTKTLLQLKMTKAPDSLFPLKPASVVTPVKPVAAHVVDEVDDVLQNGTQASNVELWPQRTKYADGETIAYIQSGTGTTYKLVKESNFTTSFKREVDGTWTKFHDHYTLGDLDAYFYGKPWSLKDAKSTLGGKTIIPGKGPNDLVSAAEIWDSRFLWKANDVVAETSEPKVGYYRRLVADENGKIFIQHRANLNDPWQTGPVSFNLKSHEDLINDWEMHLTGSVLQKPDVKKSTLVTHNEGDVVTVLDMWAGQTTANVDDVLAYSYEPVYNSVWRFKKTSAGGVLEFRPVGGTGWHLGSHVNVPDDLKSVTGMTWHAALHDGSLPNEVKAILPGNTVPSASVPTPVTPPSGAGTSTLIGNMDEGELINPNDIWETMETGWGSATTNVKTVAYAVDPNTGAHWRLVFTPGPKNTLTVASHETGKWQSTKSHSSLASFLSDSDVSTNDWFLANNDGSMPDVLPGIQSKWPGANYVGDPLSDYQMADTGAWIQHFDDYDIIAEGNSLDGQMHRIYRIDDVFVHESRLPGEAWQLQHVFTDPSVLPDSKWVNWVASDAKAAHASTQAAQAKAAIKVFKSNPVTTPKLPVTPPTVPTAPVAPAKVVLTGNQTHVPGKVFGDVVEKDAILDNYDKYVDGQIIATRSTTAYYGTTTEYRLFVANGKLVQQKTNAKGIWGGTEIINTKYDIYGKWTLTNDHVTPQHLKNAKKFVDKKLGLTVPKPPKLGPTTPPPGAIKAPSVSFGTLKHVDIAAWNDSEREEIYQFFKSKHIYVSSNAEDVWSALQHAKSHFINKYKGKYLNITEVEILRIVDERSALAHGKVDTHPFESKIVNWINTPAGRSYVNKRIDAPIAATDVPVPMNAIHTSGLDPDKQKYDVISVSDARIQRDASLTKYGPWTKTQQSALRSYTGNVSSDWNEAIRRGDLARYRSSIIQAQNGMRPSTRPMLLHRGCSFKELNDPSINDYNALLAHVGDTYINRGFNSTSVGGSAAFGGQLLIEYECPIGTPMAFVKDISQHQNENEMLLPTHLVYKILSVTLKGGTTIMRVRVLGPASP